MNKFVETQERAFRFMYRKYRNRMAFSSKYLFKLL